MKVEQSGHGGWNDYPVYSCPSWNVYEEVLNWCNENNVTIFLLSSGGAAYKFQVKTNHEWFVLRWA